MTLRDELDQVRIKEIVDSEKEFEFPDFVRCLRKSQGIPRNKMGESLGIGEMRLYYLETGSFKRVPEIALLSSISSFLGVKKDLLVRKAKEFVEGQKK